MTTPLERADAFCRRETGAPRSTLALAGALTWVGTGLGGIVMGWLSDRIGIRISVLTGSAMIASGLALSQSAVSGHDWEVLNRLHRKGMIENPVGKAKSVVLTDQGLTESERLFRKQSGRAPGRMTPCRLVAGA